MRKFIRFIIVLGLILVLVGGGIVGYAIYKGKFGPIEVETKEYVSEEDFNNLNLDLLTINVDFVRGTDTKLSVSYDAEKGYEYTFEVLNDTLSIKETDTLKWYDRLFHWEFKPRKMIVTLPKDTYEDLTLTASTGDIYCTDFNFGKVNVKTSTGSVHFTHVNAVDTITVSASTGDMYFTSLNSKELSISTSTGSVSLDSVKVNGSTTIKCSTGSTYIKNTVIQDNLKISCSTGSIRFSKSDAKTMDVHTSVGDISGDILTAKTFDAHTSTGTVRVPSTSGELCKLKTSTGDIRITISEA